MKIAASFTLTALALASILVPKPSEAESPPQGCLAGYVEVPDPLTGGTTCTKIMAPLIRCTFDKPGECKKLCADHVMTQDTRPPEKSCARLTHCDLGPETSLEILRERGVCNDLKKCETNKCCEEGLGYTQTTGQAQRECRDEGDGKKCYWNGGIVINWFKVAVLFTTLFRISFWFKDRKWKAWLSKFPPGVDPQGREGPPSDSMVESGG